MNIRKADGNEMLRLWGYGNADQVSPTAGFFYHSISSGNAVFWTVDHEGQLIGELYAFLNIEYDPDFADGKTTAYLCAFRIRKEYRSQGLGSRLMETVLADLKSMGFSRATIGADEERTRKLYQHMGFTMPVKICYYDPCAMDENMKPEYVKEGYWLRAKDL